MSRLQLNLIPDVKMDYIKQARTRNLVVTGAVVIGGACLVILILMMATVYGVQKKQLHNSDQAIAKATADLQKIPNLNRILTVQNQLTTLTGLHRSKKISSRIFSYLPAVTPTRVSIGHVSIDYTGDTMQIDGTADTQHTINVFIDTLKFTTYKLGSGSTAKPAFTSVTETSFGITPTGGTFSISLKFDPLLFGNATLDSHEKIIKPDLTVPKRTTTRSVANSSDLFNGQNTGAGQ